MSDDGNPVTGRGTGVQAGIRLRWCCDGVAGRICRGHLDMASEKELRTTPWFMTAGHYKCMKEKVKWVGVTQGHLARGSPGRSLHENLGSWGVPEKGAG